MGGKNCVGGRGGRGGRGEHDGKDDGEKDDRESNHHHLDDEMVEVHMVKNAVVVVHMVKTVVVVVHMVGNVMVVVHGVMKMVVVDRGVTHTVMVEEDRHNEPTLHDLFFRYLLLVFLVLCFSRPLPNQLVPALGGSGRSLKHCVGVNVGVFVVGVDFRWLWLCGKTKTHEMRSTKQCRPTHQSWQNLFQYPQA